MQLKDYMERNGLDVQSLAARIRRDPATVYRMLRNKSAEPETLRRLHEATDGQVTPNDVLDLHPEDAGERRSSDEMEKKGGGPD